jgi:hypothetical protein
LQIGRYLQSKRMCIFPKGKRPIGANTSIFTVLLRRLSLRTNHNSPVRAQTDDLFSGYARKTVKIFLLFAPMGRFPFGIYIFYMIYKCKKNAVNIVFTALLVICTIRKFFLLLR